MSQRGYANRVRRTPQCCDTRERGKDFLKQLQAFDRNVRRHVERDPGEVAARLREALDKTYCDRITHRSKDHWHLGNDLLCSQRSRWASYDDHIDAALQVREYR